MAPLGISGLERSGSCARTGATRDVDVCSTRALSSVNDVQWCCPQRRERFRPNHRIRSPSLRGAQREFPAGASSRRQPRVHPRVRRQHRPDRRRSSFTERLALPRSRRPEGRHGRGGGTSGASHRRRRSADLPVLVRASEPPGWPTRTAVPKRSTRVSRPRSRSCRRLCRARA
eukprot:scaffold193_cov255-Pinguiococcus_pyrenoidosus.AAC.33